MYIQGVIQKRGMKREIEEKKKGGMGGEQDRDPVPLFPPQLYLLQDRLVQEHHNLLHPVKWEAGMKLSSENWGDLQ